MGCSVKLSLICNILCSIDYILFFQNIKNSDPLTVLSHHKSKINSVKWLHRPDDSCIELLSCSADKTAAIWTLDNDIWNVTSVLSGHGDGVTCISGLYIEDDLVVYTGSIDTTMKIWERKNGRNFKLFFIFFSLKSLKAIKYYLYIFLYLCKCISYIPLIF